MNASHNKIELVTDNELSRVRGGSKVWNWVKKAAVWVKDHVKITLNSIGIGGKF